MQKALLSIALVLVAGPVAAEQPVVDAAGKFRQLGALLPTPNIYRNAAGAPGHGYWQQRADYKIDVRLDERQRRVSASETITYTNGAPDGLSYLWLQLDQNRFNANSLERRSEAAQRSANRPNPEQQE